MLGLATAPGTGDCFQRGVDHGGWLLDKVSGKDRYLGFQAQAYLNPGSYVLRCST
jgi:hypothetical protein